MLFSSFEYFSFLPIVLLSFWFAPPRVRVAILVAASAIFYGWWDWRYLGLMYLTVTSDFLIAQWIHASNELRWRRRLLALSLVINLGILGTFKYFDFFASSLQQVLAAVGVDISHASLGLVLPVGISFYTFQSLSYSIDVYRRQIEPTRSLLEYIAFVSFFPQLVAGPIERAGHLLGQFRTTFTFDVELAVTGSRQMLWGFTKKLVVADSLAPIVERAYGSPDSTGSELLAATLFFAAQIYCDFSGYSDIAIGTARLFGIDLMQNFRTPYFATSFSDFWRRWHISLSTWFRDYVYIPLGGNRCGASRHLANLAITFLLSGLWHGANWTFVIWGGLHAAFLILEHWLRSRFNAPSWGMWPQRLLTFGCVTLAWVFFRADSAGHAFSILERIALDTRPMEALAPNATPIAIVAALFAGEAFLGGALELTRLKHRPLRWLVYWTLLAAIVLLGRFSYEPFIYFQF